MEENVKKYIYSLLTSTPVTMTLKDLVKDYKNTIGESVPYHQLGYNSLEHFLFSIPDVCRVVGSGPLAQVLPAIESHEKSAHINELVTSQRIPVKKKGPIVRKRYMPPASIPKRRIHYPPSSTNSSKFSSHSSDSSLNSFGKKNLTDDILVQQKSPAVILEHTLPESNDIKTEANILKLKNINTAEAKSISTGETKTSNTFNLKNTTTIHEMFTFAQERVSNPINAKIPNRIQEKNRACANNSTKINDIKIENRTYTDKYVKKKLPELIDKPVLSKENMETNVPVTVRNNLKLLIGRFPDGIWCADVPEIYRKMFRQDLRYQELGYRSLIDLCSCLSSIFHYCRPSTEDFKLYDRSRPLPDCAEKTFTVASYSVNESHLENTAVPKVGWDDMFPFLPKDIVQPGEEIPSTFVPHDTKHDDNFDIRAGEIFDLSKFWVYMDDGKLDKLMDDLQIFYRSKSADYQIPETLITEGVYCVQIIFNEYHRAVVIDAMPNVEDTVRVLFIDYGTVAKVSIKGLCFLHTSFASLPAQAIRCRLANVCPPEEAMPWSREAAICFRKAVVKKDLVMKIVKVNWKEQFLEVHLIDVTNDNNIFYINNLLVNEGHAIWSDQEQTKSLCVHTPIVKFIHLFPTFLELENGLAPSTFEMEVYNDCNIPINFAYPQYFKMDFSSAEKYIKHIESFYEKHFRKQKRDASLHFYDMLKFKPSPLNFSIFENLESEIREFSTESAIPMLDEKHLCTEAEASTVNSDKYNIDRICNDEDLFKYVDTLKNDCLLAEDIIKDLKKIYISSTSDLENFSNELWTITEESSNSGSNRDLNSVCENVNDDFVHPLTKMSFDDNNPHSPVSSRSDSSFQELYELEENVTKTQSLVSSSEVCREIEAELLEIENQLFSRPFSDTETQLCVKTSNTNPFLQDTADELNDDDSTNFEVPRLHPNNPFLTYLNEKTEDDISCYSDVSSASTVYEMCTQELTVQHTWSTHDSGTTDGVSILESTSSYSDSLDLAKIDQSAPSSVVSVQSCADEETQIVTSSTSQNYSCPNWFPSAMPAVSNPYSTYGYPNNWNTGYGNLYHDPRFGCGYPQAVNPYYMYQYRFNQPYPHYSEMQAIPKSVPPGFVPNSNIYRPHDQHQNVTFSHFTNAPIRLQTISRMTTVSVNPHSDAQDFYEVYNQNLKEQIDTVNTDTT